MSAPRPRPQYWATFGLVAGALSFFVGLLQGASQAILCFLLALALTSAIWRWQIVTQRGDAAPAGDRPLWALLAAVVGSVILLLLTIVPTATGGTGTGPGSGSLPPAPTAAPGAAPTSSPTTAGVGPPSYSYFAKATREAEDRDATLAPGGYLEQTFTARQPRIGSIAVITAREHRPEQPFSDDDIGRVSLRLFRVAAGGRPAGEIPLQLIDDERARLGGVVLTAANHRDAVFRLRTVAVRPGDRYAFRITNAGDAILAVSVRPEPELGNPTFIKAPGASEPRRYGYAVAGYVCDRSDGC